MMNKFNKLRLVRERMVIAVLAAKLLSLAIDVVMSVLSGVGLFYGANGTTTRKMAT